MLEDLGDELSDLFYNEEYEYRGGVEYHKYKSIIRLSTIKDHFTLDGKTWKMTPADDFSLTFQDPKYGEVVASMKILESSKSLIILDDSFFKEDYYGYDQVLEYHYSLYVPNSAALSISIDGETIVTYGMNINFVDGDKDGMLDSDDSLKGSFEAKLADYSAAADFSISFKNIDITLNATHKSENLVSAINIGNIINLVEEMEDCGTVKEAGSYAKKLENMYDSALYIENSKQATIGLEVFDDEGTLGSAWKNGFFSTIGYRATLTAGRLFAGLDAGIHAAEVQDSQETSNARCATEVSLLFGYRFDFGDEISAEIGADFQFYRMVGKSPYFSVSPSLLFEYDLHRGGTLALRTYFINQYIFKNGLSNIGLPLEFWHLAGGRSAPSARSSPTSSYLVRTLSASLPNCSYPNYSISVSMLVRCMT